MREHRGFRAPPRLSATAWGAIALTACSAALGGLGAAPAVWIAVLGVGLIAGGMAFREQLRPSRTTRALGGDDVAAAARALATEAPASQRFHLDYAAEMAREQEIIRRLHAEYVNSRAEISPALVAGLEPLPPAWVEKRLQEMGETFRWNRYVP
jgi:hypothetical protein